MPSPCPRRARAVLALVLATAGMALLSACGDESDPLQDASDDVVVASASSTYASVCFDLSVNGYISDATFESLERDTEAFIELARRRPDYEYEGVTVEQHLADEASQLEECGETELARRLDRVRETL